MKKLPTIHRLWIGLLFLAVAASLPAAVESNTSRPNPDAGPTEVEMQFLLLDIDNVDSANQTFTINFFYAAKWHDPRLVHDNKEALLVQLKDIWHPSLQITNQQRLIRTLPEMAEVHPDGTVSMRQRVWGKLAQPFDLEDFPFDHQIFTITMIAVGEKKGSVKLVKTKDGIASMSNKFSLPDWKIISLDSQVEYRSLFEGFPEADLFVVRIEASRYYEYYLVKVILPLVLIVMMSWIVFWIDPSQAGPQIGVATTSMLTLIAYRFAIAKDMPVVPYLTRIDIFILGSTLAVFVTLNEAVITAALTHNKKSQLAHRIDYIFRFIMPPVFVTIMYIALVR
ncbi:hypothetical protein [Persicirhabdus sediminis]|uniref:Neurotransmitter-gated ion-channel ligand binding domain-containing protein n=1 Tax=Persicirhabdus sediminis TaxID=454144 RepID=A0A8J7MDL1_9BACT|nr:hypothetical protein [Persicirhabdus sediminis]MBK1791859.1 hypothetical protein [Persicirhabdus sediminis]